MKWFAAQIERHFADVCLMLLIMFLLTTVISLAVFSKFMGWAVVPENMSWVREMVSSVIGCLLGRLAKIDSRSDIKTIEEVK